MDYPCVMSRLNAAACATFLLAMLLLTQLSAFAATHELGDEAVLQVDEKADIFLVVQPPSGSPQDQGLESTVNKYAPGIAKDRLAVILEDREAGDPLKIPWTWLAPDVRASIILDLFPGDRPAEGGGWSHQVSLPDESFSMLSRLFHGDDDLILDLFTRLGRDLERGDRILLRGRDFSPGLKKALHDLAAHKGLRPESGTGAGGEDDAGHAGDDDMQDQDAGAALRHRPRPLPSPKGGLVYKRDESGEVYAEYLVRRGDSLYSIARRFTDRKRPERVNAAVRVIQRASGLKRASSIRPGDKVVIPSSLLGGDYTVGKVSIISVPPSAGQSTPIVPPSPSTTPLQ